MKRLIYTLVIALVATIGAWAAPAYPEPVTIRQADGTLLTVRQFGDEHHHWTETTDGTLVVNTGHGYYVAQIDLQGRLSASSILAHEPQHRQADEQALVSQQLQRVALFHEKGNETRRRAMSISTMGKYLPHTGSPRVLTVMVEFSDYGFTVNEPVNAFNQYLNGDSQADLGNMNHYNIASVRQYFETGSHGQFSPRFDIVGPITLPETLEYYGGTSATGSDDKFSTLCRDAMAQAKELVEDWTLYDNDGDGIVELVCIIFAGYGQNQGGTNNTIWAKASTQNMRLDNEVTITRFNCCCEKFHPSESYKDFINGIGVFTHEFSHCMGLPDLYATSSSAYVNNQGMESYDVMDYGLYNRNGFAPSLYTAWEQETMGWIELEALTETQYINDMQSLEMGGQAYKIPSPDNERDFIVLENIQKSGLNSYANGHGLLAYHVAYPRAEVNMGDSPNNNAGFPSVAVVPASGMLISSFLRQTSSKPENPYTADEWRASLAAAPFPGTSAITELSDESQEPNFCFYQSGSYAPVGHFLYNITEDEANGTVSFYFDTKEAPVEPEEPIEITPVDGEEPTVVTVGDMTDADLTNNVIDNVYYNLGEESGFDADEQCLVLGEATDMSAITDAEPGSDEMKANFTGIVVQLTQGMGTFAVNARTQGTLALAIQIGSNEPTLTTVEEQGDIVVDYDVAEPTYVYVYAVNAPATEAPQRALGVNGVAIYGITVTPGASTGIQIVVTEEQPAVYYNLAGQRVSHPTNGIYIVKGKKVKK